MGERSEVTLRIPRHGLQTPSTDGTGLQPVCLSCRSLVPVSREAKWRCSFSWEARTVAVASPHVQINLTRRATENISNVEGTYMLTLNDKPSIRLRLESGPCLSRASPCMAAPDWATFLFEYSVVQPRAVQHVSRAFPSGLRAHVHRLVCWVEKPCPQEHGIQ